MSICRSPFLIWFTGRTGSTFLCDLLNSHPQIHCRREDFCECRLDPGMDLSPRKIVEISGGAFYRRIHRSDGFIEDPTETATLEYLKQIYSQNFAACGFKLKHPNQFIAFPEIVEQLRDMPTLKLIGLQRRNVLKQAVSLNNVKRLRTLGVVDSGNSKTSVSLEPIEVDVDETIKHARFFDRCKSDLTSFAEPFDQFLRVNYEDVIGDSKATLQSLLEFLEVESEHVELHSNFKKVTPDNLSDAVLNYDQLVDAIVGTDLEPYLE